MDPTDPIPVALPAEEASERSGGDDDDAGGDDVVPEEVFLRAASRGAGDGGFKDGWIGGRPVVESESDPRSAGGMTRVASGASAATVSDGDDGDDEAPEKKKKRTTPSAKRRGDAQKIDRGSPPSSSAEAEFDFGVVAEHEAAMARLLGPSRTVGGVADYGATARVSPRRRTGTRAANDDADDDAVDDAVDARAGGVSFSNALPRIR